MPGKHARLSPSSAARWRRCKASVAACEDLADESGFPAAEGTVFHHFMDLCLEFGFEPDVFIGSALLVDYRETQDDGRVIDGQWRIEFDGEMADHARAGLDFLESWQDDDTLVFYETRVDISPWLGADQFGTADVIMIDVKSRRMLVFDWKYGYEPVSPVFNDQAICYGLGSWHTIAEKYFEGDASEITVEICIEQPRAPGGGGIWQTTMKRLLKEGKTLKDDADETHNPEAEFVAGHTQCKYCPRGKSKEGCGALDQFVAEMLELDYDSVMVDHEIELPENLSPEARSTVIINRKLIETWIDRLLSSAISDYKNDLPTPDLKMVAGRRSARKVRPDQEKRYEKVLKNLLDDDAFAKKLLTPAAAEKKLGKKVFDPLFSRFVLQDEGKPTLVPEKDSRTAIASDLAEYDDLVDD